MFARSFLFIALIAVGNFKNDVFNNNDIVTITFFISSKCKCDIGRDIDNMYDTYQIQKE